MLLFLPVVPQWLACDPSPPRRLRWRIKHKDVAKSFALQVTQRTSQILALPFDDVRTKIAGRDADRFRSRQMRSGISSTIATGRQVILSGERHEWFACLRLHIGRVDNRQASSRQAFARDEVEHVEVDRAPVAAWSFSSSETNPRQKSDDNTSVGV